MITGRQEHRGPLAAHQGVQHNQLPGPGQVHRGEAVQGQGGHETGGDQRDHVQVWKKGRGMF